MKLSIEQSTWELFASCEDQLKAECQLFHFKFHEEEKLQTHVPTHPWEFFSTLDRAQHVGVWKHFQSVALNIFLPRVKIPSSSYATDEKIFALEAKWTNMETESGPGAALGWREPCLVLGEVPEDTHSLWVHCPLQLRKWVLHLISQLIVLKLWRRKCPCYRWWNWGT